MNADRAPQLKAGVGRLVGGKLGLRILLLIVMLVLEATPSLATECSARRSVSEELKNSTVVFSGKAVAEEYRPNDTPQPGWPGGEILVIKFSVGRWWKGSGAGEVFLYTGFTRFPGGYTRSSGEDFHFSVGEEYLVYAFGNVDSLSTTACQRTTKLEKAAEDLKALGEGKLPEKKKASRVPSPSNKALQLTAHSMVLK